MPPVPDAIVNLAIALALGLLVGLERETAASRLSGIRTFAIVTVLGAVCGILIPVAGGWIVAAALLSLAIVIVIGNYVLMHDDDTRGGITTESALLLMLLVGVLVSTGARQLGVVIGGSVAVLLQAKARMKGIASRLSTEDLTAIMRFALLALVILPVLPDSDFGPYNVLNLYEIWMMVVLIVGISLGGYIVYRFFGQKAGVLAGGVLGGVISSTATTVSYARRTRDSKEASGLAAAVIMIASTIVVIRVAIEIAVVAPRFLPLAAAPLGIVFAAMLAVSIVAWLWMRDGENAMPEQENPSELKPALIFGALYAFVLLAVAFAKDRLGTEGLYAVAALAGLTDVDAITLSTSKLVAASQLEPGRAWRLIVVANASNLVFKAATVAVLGSRALLGRVALLYAVAVGVSIALVFLWPT
jgi:uncharacterized membrane protein (DUF4010 family)